ncbi:hypothetical protein [Mycobacteroides abscessus]|uniref:hypothetical protein n=1 Tax=Mycobacteroides abscessus TaxID=36809 RepID=UPI0009282997|nr:hypothetical protein [Mycobacteroides abscessus]SHX65638.1 Uncharacterised protein [Mycobacteroides abscessus subsp. abscessus]SHZ17287.1 Uncharacterised protein [Mycobacteroides abscessus subsp. abscessus]SIB51680.1 Uncharacterised protein [Mycobacteroides abscessus subsp. abscessus]SIF17499.1 Uncharacterised protein [Mycobacteroides abscessus subsp. abscessus]SKI47860.1 Uncharacterised protein [Mycobacteroides abscessus subsp. abscessus]
MTDLSSLHLPAGAVMTAGVGDRRVAYVHATGPDPLQPYGLLSGDDELMDRVAEIQAEGAADSDTWINVPAHPMAHRGQAPIPWLFADSRETLPDLMLAMSLAVGKRGWLSRELAAYLTRMASTAIDRSERDCQEADYLVETDPLTVWQREQNAVPIGRGRRPRNPPTVVLSGESAGLPLLWVQRAGMGTGPAFGYWAGDPELVALAVAMRGSLRDPLDIRGLAHVVSKLCDTTDDITGLWALDYEMRGSLR